MQNITILNKVTNDLTGELEQLLGDKAPTLTVYDSIENKEISFKVRVKKKGVQAEAEVSDVPIQHRALNTGIAICDNVITKGEVLELEIIETETLGVLETMGSALGYGKRVVDAGMGASSVQNLKAILEKAQANAFYLKYEQGREVHKSLIVLGKKYQEVALDGERQVELELRLKETQSFAIHGTFPSKTSVVKPAPSGVIEGLSGAVGSVTNALSRGFSTRQVLQLSKDALPDDSAADGAIEPRTLEILPVFNFGDYYNFETNFYLGKFFLNLTFKYIDVKDKYEISIYSDNTMVFSGIARFFEPLPGAFGFNVEVASALRPRGSFVFLPKQSARLKSAENITKEDFADLNFRLFFIESV